MRLSTSSFALTLVGLAVSSYAASEPPLRPALRWVVAQRDLDFGVWRGRIAGRTEGAGDELWIGGAPASESSAGNLYRLDGGEWRLAHTLGISGARTFVLALDPARRLWVAPYPQDAAKIYAHLEVRHLERGVWHREILTPGLWPQAMAWPSRDEGWIAGNNGLFYHHRRDGWRLETLDLPESERRDVNILALRMQTATEGWAAGSMGLLAAYEAGRWRRLAVPARLAAENLEALDRTADGTIWIAGTRGTLAARGRDGAWRIWRAPGEMELLGIDMVDGQDGWAVGAGGTILRFDGTTWSAQPSPTRSTLSDVRMSGADRGWIAGSSLALRATVDPAPHFWDRSLDLTALAGRGAEQIAALDADGDGDLDLFTVDLDAVHRYENRGTWTWAEREDLQPGPRREIAPGGVAWGDADGDGHLDMVVVGKRPGKVWLDRLRGGLEADAPRALAVSRPGSPRDLPARVDLDGDGHLDLRFIRSSAGAAPLVLWGDLDGDLDLDLLQGSASHGVELWRNEGGRLRLATHGSGLDRSFDPAAIGQGVAWDLDRDGDLDLLLLGSRLHAFSNDGRGHFSEHPDWVEGLDSNPAFSQLQVAAGDLDLDGWPEILLSPVDGSRAHVALLARDAAGRYRDIASAAGVRDLAGKAAAFADLDGDGDLDLLVTGAKRTYLLANLASQEEGGRFLKVRVRGAEGDPWARGAQVRVYDAGRLGDPLALRGFQCVGVGLPGTGVSHLSELVFGVPAHGRFDVEARFIDGRRTLLRGVPAGSVATLFELPWGPRQAAIAGARIRRAVRLADPLRTALLLAAGLGLALALRTAPARRIGSAEVSRHPSVVALLPLLQGATAVAVVDRPPWIAGPLLSAVSLGSALLLLAIDGSRAAWRRARGATHLGPYRLLALIGEGGMGSVWRARHLVSHREVALKVLQAHRTAEEAHRTRFLREGAILARLNHPNIVRVYETGEIGGRGFISMERLSGSTLGACLRRCGPLPAESALAFLVVASEALSEVHRSGIVHRDVKTDNFFVIGDEGDEGDEIDLPATLAQWRSRLKLMDFGLAHLRELATLTLADGLVGTLAYLAPEQASGSAHDPRSDLYALGVVAFEISLGRLPPSHLSEGPGIGSSAREPVERELRALPLPFARLLSRLLAREPRLRPASAEEVAESAELCLGARVAGARGQGSAAATDPEIAETSTPSERLWQIRLSEIRRILGCGRAAEAQVHLLTLIAELRQRLESLAPEERNRYARRHRLSEVLDLERQTRIGLQEMP